MTIIPTLSTTCPPPNPAEERRYRCINCELLVAWWQMEHSCPAIGSHGHVVSADLGGKPDHPYLTAEHQPRIYP